MTKRVTASSVLLCASFTACAHSPRDGVTRTEVEIHRGNPQQIPCAPTGPCTVEEEGIVLAKGTLEEGKLVGPWQFYDAQGRLREEGRYVDGLRQGRWTYRGVFSSTSGDSIQLETRNYETSDIDAEGEFFDGVMKGPWVLTTPEYTITIPFSGELFTDGLWGGFVKPHGRFVQTNAEGATIAEGRYEDGEPVGEWRTWYDDGTLHATRQAPNGPFVEYYENGTKSRSGTLAGSLRSWNEDDVVEWHEHLPLVRRGHRSTWRYGPKEDATGKPVSDLGEPCPDGTTLAGAVDGERVAQWCEKKQVAVAEPWSSAVTDVELPRMASPQGSDGLEVETVGEGVRMVSAVAEKHGPFRAWSVVVGSLEEEGTYVDGERDGEWVYFDASGRPERTETWREGEMHE